MTNHDKIQQLKDYILAKKNPEDKIYDPYTYTNWEEHLVVNQERSPLKWRIFKITLADGQIVYNVSDENGMAALPKADVDYKIELKIIIDEDNPFATAFINTEDDLGFSWSSFWAYVLVYGGLALFVLIKFFGPAIIEYYKEKNDPVRKHIERIGKEHATYHNLIVSKLDSVKTAHPFLYVYTNDTDTLSFVIEPNMERYEDPFKKHNIDMFDFIVQEQKNAVLKNFIDNEKEQGYNIWLKTTRKYLLIGNYTQDTTIEKYNVDMTYFYTDREKEIVKRAREKRDKREKYTIDSPLKEPHIDSLQTSSVILSLEELATGDYNHPIKALFAPRVNPKNTTQKIYFTIFSKNGTKAELDNKIEAFQHMFCKGKKCKDFTIRKVMQE